MFTTSPAEAIVAIAIPMDIIKTEMYFENL